MRRKRMKSSILISFQLIIRPRACIIAQVRNIYTIGFYLALPVILLRLWWRGRKLPAYRRHVQERLGKYSAKPLANAIWLHAVSYGETVAAEPLIHALLETYPDTPIVVTHMTPTGRARAQKTFADKVLHSYIPYDVPKFIKRFIQHFQPKLVILMETELWPNILCTVGQHHIPIIIANARLSERSAKGYLKISKLCQTMLRNISHVATQSAADKERFIKIGMPSAKVSVLGNMKFDIHQPEQLITQGKSLRQDYAPHRPVWIAASTHEGEEDIILNTHKILKNNLPESLLILVPRHPDRFEIVAQLCHQAGYKTVRRSEQTPIETNTDILLGDTMGEMYLFYAAADIAFVAGSFAKIGGHNLLEPALVGLPVLTGPMLFNTIEISELLINAGNTHIVHNAQELAQTLLKLFQDQPQRITMGEKGQQTIAKHRGALERHLALIQSQYSPTEANTQI